MRKIMTKKINIPHGLSDETAKFYWEVVESFELESHHLRLLTIACESWDRREQAREALRTEGLTVRDVKGIVKTHPAVAIERDSTTIFIKALRELNLDIPASGKQLPDLRHYRA
jgi:P27 family predicted phage terminase small subunit